MPDIDIDLYCEDIDQESFVGPLVRRIGREYGLTPVVHPRSVRGGKGKVREQVTARQRALAKGQTGLEMPDLLVVSVDANSAGTGPTRAEVREYVDESLTPRLAVACPDPHIERWYVADPATFSNVTGVDPTLPKQKHSKDVYKNHLRKLLDEAEIEILLGAHEIGPDIAEDMDLYVAGKADPGFKLFVDEVRQACTSVASNLQ
jgi:hypothetical protein